MKIVFMGTPDFAAVILEGLIKKGHEIVFAVTQPDKMRGRGNKIQFSSVKEVALNNGIRVLQPERVRGNEDFLRELKEAAPDISVVAAYGQILPKDVLETPKFGSINVHASLLPELRGASPIQHAILLGKKETGVTIMQMGEGLDTGDMISKVIVPISDMNFSELHDALAIKGRDLLIDTLEDIREGRATFEKQDDALSSYAPMISKQDGHLDFKKSPDEIICMIRAFDPWPGAFAIYNEKGEAMKFWKAEKTELKTDLSLAGQIIDVDDSSFIVSSGGGALRVTEIQVPGKKRCTVEAYLRGNTLEKGLLFK